ncbi:uncharacterized protein LOC6725648 [Drosophila simulans]|uniref:GD17004 n=1 Tax=Drosophila simulans TaxID=7240 RepID=B4R2R4_DROSI|nr:uncharacterized protein LOC6725648 [Drosophila simulans]EDX17613.1 GD17004 [Drosophila simulans]KMZ09184.1 uncharacterized protein Dsimw501_GD17004 [Drosophila simulans]
MESISIVIHLVAMMSLIIGGSQAIPYRSSAYLYNQQFCMDTLTGRQLYIGEVFTREDQCVRIQCLESQQLWEDSCQVPKLTQGNCKPVPSTEPHAEYPRCCPLYECKSYESNSGGTLEQTNTYNHYGTLRSSHLTEMIVIDRRTLPRGEIPTASARKYQV